MYHYKVNIFCENSYFTKKLIAAQLYMEHKRVLGCSLLGEYGMDKKKRELKELLDIYERELCDRVFKYQLNYNIDIEIVFYIENFCHLLGLQHIYTKNKKYLGINGYYKIKDDELKRSDLKKHNKTEYNKLKIKLDHFDEISSMLRYGKFIKFYQYRTKPLSMIVAEF